MLGLVCSMTMTSSGYFNQFNYFIKVIFLDIFQVNKQKNIKYNVMLHNFHNIYSSYISSKKINKQINNVSVYGNSLFSLPYGSFFVCDKLKVGHRMTSDLQ